MQKKTAGFEAIAQERIRQLSDHQKASIVFKSDLVKNNELLKAAAYCLTGAEWPATWGTDLRDTIESYSLFDRLVAAGAFISAHMDQISGIEDWQIGAITEKYTGWDKFAAWVKEREEKLNGCRSGTILERIAGIIGHYQGETQKATAKNIKIQEETKIYIRSISMLVEMIMMAGTHGEKNARTRGLLEFLNKTAEKLDKGYEEDLFGGWRFSPFGNSQSPYESILRQLDEVKRENEALKGFVKGKGMEDEIKDLPF